MDVLTWVVKDTVIKSRLLRGFLRIESKGKSDSNNRIKE
jgi:hypothetical protein